MSDVVIHEREIVPLADLKPHPRNYRRHPDDQLRHLDQSLAEHGMYRNIVVARDGTILAGHGVAEAARRKRLENVAVVRLDLDPNDPKALKLLAGDNELTRLAEVDDRGLSELLKEIKDVDVDGLLGTGLDEKMLANLLFVTRPAAEIRTLSEAEQWVGLPSFDPAAADILLVLHFDSEEEREKLIEQIGVGISKKTRQTWSAHWPPREKQDLASLRFQPEPPE